MHRRCIYVRGRFVEELLQAVEAILHGVVRDVDNVVQEQLRGPTERFAEEYGQKLLR